ncbi:Hemolysin secretion protein D, chromosomal [Agrobacterium sp. DSM 25558]|nr:Hemolysin secretion protein D, chromosomal [Agrobacterium sp. DSM 25558]
MLISGTSRTETYEMRASRSNTKHPKRDREDMEFLPSHLEILETPASPIRVAFLWLICMLAIFSLLWGWYGKFDIVATAQGKVQPTGRVKIIQSLQPGKTKSVAVRDGERVAEGDVIVQLDDTDVTAELMAKRTILKNLEDEIYRRDAKAAVLLRLNREITSPDRNAVSDLFTQSDLEENGIAARERDVFDAEITEIIANLGSLSAQRMQRRAEIVGMADAVESQRSLVKTLGEQIQIRSQLLSSRVGSQMAVLDATREYQKSAADLSDKVAQMKSSEAALQVITAEELKLLRTALSDNANRKIEAQRQADELAQEVVKAEVRKDLLTIKSPISGTVQLSSITTIGQVVAANTELMRVLPDGATLEIEAFLTNKDIGFVSVGQSSIIKVDAYPFTRFGVLKGRVKSISSDAIPEPDAENLERTASRQQSQGIPTGNVQRVQNLVFPMVIEFEHLGTQEGANAIHVSPGMTASVEIQTGQRRILEYLFSPIAQVTSEAMAER